MKFVRKHTEVLDEARWFAQNPTFASNHTDVNIKTIYKIINDYKNKGISEILKCSQPVNEKFYRYIGGQLIESRIGSLLKLTNRKDKLDGTYHGENNSEYYIEIKAWINTPSSRQKMFTPNERTTINSNNNAYAIICEYEVKPINPDKDGYASEVHYIITNFHIVDHV